MLHHRQHLPSTDEAPSDAANPDAARTQAPLPLHCMADTACPPSPKCEEQPRSVQVRISPLTLTSLYKTPATDVVVLHGKDCQYHANQLSQQQFALGSPGMGTKSSSRYKSSRSSSEECRGSRCGAEVAVGIVRPATCPPQLALESQRGSNSPKKSGPRRFSQPGMRSVLKIVQKLKISALTHHICSVQYVVMAVFRWQQSSLHPISVLTLELLC